jgi:hypothetical protein
VELYEVVIIENPTKKERKNNIKPEILVGPNLVFGEDEQAVSYETIVNNADLLKDKDANRIEVRIRPF